MVVDDDNCCLKIVSKLLKSCDYEVTMCSGGKQALELLAENRNGYDIVLSDVSMPGMDGFALMSTIGLQMDLPVLMMSGKSDTATVFKGISHGAVDYLIKPVRIEELRNIWQHVVRRKKLDSKDIRPDSTPEDGEEGDVDLENEKGSEGKTTLKRRKNKGGDGEDSQDESDQGDGDKNAMPKKPRVVWSVVLHQKFVTAVNTLGVDKAVPKRILDLMNVSGLTRENVASHLQKYRLYLKRLAQAQALEAQSASQSNTNKLNDVRLKLHLAQQQANSPIGFPLGFDAGSVGQVMLAQRGALGNLGLPDMLSDEAGASIPGHFVDFGNVGLASNLLRGETFGDAVNELVNEELSLGGPVNLSSMNLNTTNSPAGRSLGRGLAGASGGAGLAEEFKALANPLPGGSIFGNNPGLNSDLDLQDLIGGMTQNS
eukprot:CAMPEP_0197858458 /NCGR_PEP_ID=MMETSP1438-20131217/32276_1 /TAXON_ID=1461541 /ORGANISM="Pterosperma sp., Strain CCMP1384" /LENGTH=427 /DNA_ID=CAMNT_0043474627 /DNA_START=138 /DNA_END=1424 /DNA_ORIENTATION=-